MILFKHCCGGIHSREQLHGQGYKTDPIFMNACVFCISCSQLKVLNEGCEYLSLILKQNYICNLKQVLVSRWVIGYSLYINFILRINLQMFIMNQILKELK